MGHHNRAERATPGCRDTLADPRNGSALRFRPGAQLPAPPGRDRRADGRSNPLALSPAALPHRRWSLPPSSEGSGRGKPRLHPGQPTTLGPRCHHQLRRRGRPHWEPTQRRPSDFGAGHSQPRNGRASGHQRLIRHCDHSMTKAPTGNRSGPSSAQVGGCGGYEIRTREGLPPTRFPSVRPRPLGESSVGELTRCRRVLANHYP